MLTRDLSRQVKNLVFSCTRFHEEAAAYLVFLLIKLLHVSEYAETQISIPALSAIVTFPIIVLLLKEGNFFLKN